VNFQTIAIEVSEHRIATLLLNRPERGNAFDQTMLDEMAEAFGVLGADDEVRIVVLRGSGRHFCTGADIGAQKAQAPAGGAARATLREVLAQLDGLPKPTLAVVQGAAIGGGAAFAACCDVVVAAESAFFAIPEVRVGMPPLGVAPFVIRAIGHRAFRRYGLSGERFSATEALRLGLAHEVCADEETLKEAAARIANELLHGAPGAVATLKRATAQYASPTLDTILAQQPHDPRTPEAIEGIASFREKRNPKWYPQ
jgi:methylglutaconyl-CoA hydratase